MEFRTIRHYKKQIKRNKKFPYMRSMLCNIWYLIFMLITKKINQYIKKNIFIIKNKFNISSTCEYPKEILLKITQVKLKSWQKTSRKPKELFLSERVPHRMRLSPEPTYFQKLRRNMWILLWRLSLIIWKIFCLRS